MKILITHAFKKFAKKLLHDQIKLVENVIEKIAKNPEMGELKKGDLAGIRVYKFYIHKQLLLLAYKHSEKELILLSLNVKV